MPYTVLTEKGQGEEDGHGVEVLLFGGPRLRQRRLRLLRLVLPDDRRRRRDV